jgi:hypothetical protein
MMGLRSDERLARGWREPLPLPSVTFGTKEKIEKHSADRRVEREGN